MKLTEDDLSAQTNVRVHLDIWLKRHEWQQILDDYEKARKWEQYELENDALEDVKRYGERIEQNQKLREICERLNITEETDVSEIAEFLEENKK